MAEPSSIGEGILILPITPVPLDIFPNKYRGRIKLWIDITKGGGDGEYRHHPANHGSMTHHVEQPPKQFAQSKA